MLRPRVTLTTSFDRYITAKKMVEFRPPAKTVYTLPDGRVLGSLDSEQNACVEALFDNQLFITAQDIHHLQPSTQPQGL
jgi:hypothetical protein